MTKTQTLKGFRDFLPREVRKRQYVIDILKKVFGSYGFEPLETPALEYEEVLLGKYGAEGDKLMYRFADNGGRKVALRYDQTVPLARVVAEYQNQLPTPFKRYQIQPVWRAENTQKGRYREFLQCDIDIVGSRSPFSDAEIIAVTAKSLKKLGVGNFKILINDRRNFSLTTSVKLSDKDFISVIRAIDKLKKIGREGVLKELEEIGINKEEAVNLLQELETREQSIYMKEIFKMLEQLGVDKNKLEYYPTLARGLDYYTGMIFEVEIEGYSAGSVAGGGRYDNLIGLFSGNNTPAVGVAFGFDRIIEAMDELGLFPPDLVTTKVLVTIFSPNLADKSLEISSRLRSNNINTEIWLDSEAKLDKQLKYADQKGIPYVVIIGPDETAKGTITLKSLKSQTQETLTLDELVSKLAS